LLILQPEKVEATALLPTNPEEGEGVFLRNGLHDKMELFVTTAVRISNLAKEETVSFFIMGAVPKRSLGC
jgi:hypothetical protein